LVEFISAKSETPTSVTEDDNENINQAAEDSSEENSQNLELLVKEKSQKLPEIPQIEDKTYVEETSGGEKEYQQILPADMNIAVNFKDTLLSLAYEENEQTVLVDIFERYGQKEDKWWKTQTLF